MTLLCSSNNGHNFGAMAAVETTDHKTNEDDDDDDDDDLVDKFLSSNSYPPKSKLFDKTNVILKSFPMSMTDSSSVDNNENEQKKSLSWFIQEILPSTITTTNTTNNNNNNNNNKQSNSNDANSFIRTLNAFFTSNKNTNKNKVNNYKSLDNYIDVSIEFDNAYIGAKELVNSCLQQKKQQQQDPPCDCCNDDSSTINTEINHFQENITDNNHQENQVIIEYFTTIFQYFQDSITCTPFNQDNISTNFNDRSYRYKARIISSLGQKGMKCPRWHIDYVPVRLIMSLKGPGCIYVPYETEMKTVKKKKHMAKEEKMIMVNRKALTNGIDEVDSMIANSIIMPNDSERRLAKVGKEMEAVLLMGRLWEGEGREEGFIKQRQQQQQQQVHQSSNDDNVGMNVLAVPHRSPNLEYDEMRILLTVDILPLD